MFSGSTLISLKKRVAMISAHERQLVGCPDLAFAVELSTCNLMTLALSSKPSLKLKGFTYQT
jgi:hypothetical protein